MSDLKLQLNTDMKIAMKSGDKRRLGVIRLANAAILQCEIDTRIELDDTKVIAVLDKMAKQRRESMQHYRTAGRNDLLQQEEFELEVLQHYLPEALDEREIDTMIAAAIENCRSNTLYRFRATTAYHALVRRRIDELRETRIEGLQTFRQEVRYCRGDRKTGKRWTQGIQACQGKGQANCSCYAQGACNLNGSVYHERKQRHTNRRTGH